MKRLRYYLAFLTVRPRRWFFGNCCWRGSCDIQWLPRRRDDWDEYDQWEGREPAILRNIEWPNLHWVLAYSTVFAFFKWLYYDGWRPLCRWEQRANGYFIRASFPWYARLVRWIGQTTAGQAIHSSECWHCAAPDCDPASLSEDDSGETFILEASGTSATMDGTDHWFRGTSICPKCGWREEYGDGSL